MPTWVKKIGVKNIAKHKNLLLHILVILKLKNINFIAIKILFLNDVEIDNTVISNKICSAEKSYKYFIGYIDYYNIKSFSIILPKPSAYVRSYDGGTKCMCF